MNTLFRTTTLSLAALLLLAANGASAQALDRLQQTTWMRLGDFQAHVDSSVRVDYYGAPMLGIPGAGTSLDFEDHLGMARSKSVPTVLIGLRLAERWRLELEGSRLNRSATRQLLGDSVVIGGKTYDLSASLHSSFDTSVLRFGAGYSLVKTGQAEAGFALGVQQTRYRLAFSGIASVTGLPPAETSLVEQDSGPLPTIGLYGTVGLSPAWSLSARADFLPVNNRHHQGGLDNFQTNLYYSFNRNWSAALGYRFVDYKISPKNSGDFGVGWQYRYRGPQWMLEAGF